MVSYEYFQKILRDVDKVTLRKVYAKILYEHTMSRLSLKLKVHGVFVIYCFYPFHLL